MLLLPDIILKELNACDYLCDYTSSTVWNPDAPFGELHQELLEVLELYEIIAYPNTRMSNKKRLENNGLIFSDDITYY